MTASFRMAAILAAATLPTLLGAQQQAPAAAVRSVPVGNLRYEITFDSATARRHTIAVAVNFDVGDKGAVLLSFPSWTPGSYEISNFARFVSGFSATAAGKPLDWDKLDYDTWRIDPAGAHSVTVRFDCHAVTLDNADGLESVRLRVRERDQHLPLSRGPRFRVSGVGDGEDSARLAGGHQHGACRRGRHLARVNYHDLVDKPFFIGRFDVDSQQVEGRWHRLVTYPVGAMAGPARSLIWDQIGKTVPKMAAVFRETPWRTYSTMMVFTREVGGGSALEHQTRTWGSTTPASSGTRCSPRSPPTRSSTPGT